MSATPALRDQRLRRWEQRTGGWLIGLALVYLTAYAVPILDPGLPRAWRDAAETVTFAIWALLAAEFVLRFAVAGSRWQFLKVRLFDLATLVLPPLRPLRLVTLVFMVVRRNASTLGRVRLRLGTYVAACTALLLFLSSLTILDVERRNPDASITAFGDALWWSLTTVTTVGYGDLYPTTTEGRLIAVALMVGGIALAGLVTATLASWFMDRFSELRANEAQTTSEISALTEEVRRLREELHTRRPTAPSASAEGPHTAGANGPGTTSGGAPGLETGTADGTPGASGTRAPSRLA
ncbi:potassium channel family protein [Streptomyces sp. NPDC006999]|uniref:potassium channel family protein n=1 Tax=Streptomyces sp. NPDC006999 TaxID=3156909 RepID=UPI0033FD5897